MKNEHDKTIGIFNYKEEFLKSLKKQDEDDNVTSSEKPNEDIASASNSNESIVNNANDQNDVLKVAEDNSKNNDYFNLPDYHDKTTNIYNMKNKFDATINIYNHQAVKQQPESKKENSKEKQENVPLNLKFGNSSQDKDIIKNIEVAQSELRNDNKILVDIGDGQKISLAIPETSDSIKQVVLKGLGNTINNEVGDLILNITIIDDDEKIYYDKEKVNYDYILFATPEEKNNEIVKILKLKRKKILISLNRNLENLEIIKIKNANKIKRVLLVLINDPIQAQKLNKKIYQTKIKINTKDNKGIIKKYVKYQKNYHLIDIPQSEKLQYFCLSNSKKPFKVLVVKTSIKTTILNILKCCFAIFLMIGGYIFFHILGVIISLIIIFLLFDSSNKYD